MSNATKNEALSPSIALKPLKKDWWAEILEWAETLTFSLAVVITIFSFIFKLVMVDGSSMSPTMHDNDRVIVEHIFYQPKQGDIVVVIKPETNNNKPLIKRIVAVEGQTVDIDFRAGVVYVDGKPLKEPYLKEPTYKAGRLAFPYTVEPGFVFVMGDNRNNSMDSREFGSVEKTRILGRAMFRIFPFTDIGTVK